MIDYVSCEILLRLVTVSLAITIHETEQIHTMFMIIGTSLRTYETNNWLDLDEPAVIMQFAGVLKGVVDAVDEQGLIITFRGL